MPEESPILTPAKLKDAIGEYEALMQGPRKVRVSAFAEYLGRHYTGSFSDEKKRPLNPLRRTVTSLSALLAAKSPVFDVSTTIPPLRVEARIWADMMNRKAKELDFRRYLKVAVKDAILSPRSVWRTGIRAGSDVLGVFGRENNVGDWYLRRVDFDRHLHDPQATDKDSIAWEGEIVSVPKALVLASGLYDNSIVEKIPAHAAASPTRQQQVAELSGKRRTNTGDDIIELIDLYEVFFYDLMGDGATIKVVMPVDYETDRFLSIDEYEGPTKGPYHWLQYDEIPDNILGFSIAAQMLEQHEAAGQMYAKLQAQAQASRSKAVYGENVPKADIDAVESDDEAPVRMQDPNAAKVLNLSVISPELMAIAERFAEIANQMGRNPEMLTGTGSDAGTATEFSGLMGMAQSQLQDLQESTEAWIESIARDLLWHLMIDPRVNYQTRLRLPTGRNIEVQFTPEQKEGEFEDYALKIKPGSAAYVDKAIQGRQLIDVLAQAPALLQLTMLSQGQINGIKALELALRRFGEDEADQIINDPEMLMETMMRMAAYGQMPGMGQPMGGGMMPQQQAMGPAQRQERRPIDETRSAYSGATPEGVGA